jgi:hypothetical protein
LFLVPGKQVLVTDLGAQVTWTGSDCTVLLPPHYRSGTFREDHQMADKSDSHSHFLIYLLLRLTVPFFLIHLTFALLKEGRIS